MRESIGTVSLLNFIIFFIFLIFAFLMGTFSYYKAYRVNNSIVSAIEKFEGYNDYSKKEIDEKLSTLGYERIEFNCQKKENTITIDKTNKKTGVLIAGHNVKPPATKVTGYCIYENEDTTTSGNTDIYNSYEVTTIITFKFPVIQSLLKLHVSSRTARIYDFESSRGAMVIE